VYAKPIECPQKFLKFDLQLGHGDFVKHMGADPNETRFASKDFDLST
jgi:hypothetical protein